MPALPNVPGVLKCNIDWAIGGDATAQSILFFQFSGPAAAADLSAIGTHIVLTGEAEFQALCDDQTGMQSATMRDLSTSMGAETTSGTPWLGARGSALTPAATSAVVSHSISRHYRGGHPRTYLPVGVSGDLLTSKLWTTSFQGAVDSAWGSFIGNIIGFSSGSTTITGFVNVSYYGPPNRLITGSTGRVRTVSTVRAAPIVDSITGHVTRQKVGSQRRRNQNA